MSCNPNAKILCKEEDCDICFSRSFTSHEKSKFWSDKNDKEPREVLCGSGNKYWFNCDKCSHIFIKKICDITKQQNPTWCPYCAHLKLCEDNNCKECFENSFASHEKAKYWSDKNDLKQRQVFKLSNKKYWFNCNICNHLFNFMLSSFKQDAWCSYCGNKNLCDDSNCNICFNKSFASHYKSIHWSKNNKLKPRNIFKNTNNKYLFICDICNHEFNIRICNITKKNPIWCYYCSNSKLCNNDDCKICFEKSVASHEKSMYLSKKNKINPRKIFKGSCKKCWFICIKCNHEFISRINKVMRIKNPTWCPYCSNNILCNNNLCLICENKSFSKNNKVIYWSNKNILNPRQVFMGSSKFFLFNCDKCDNEFKMSPDLIIHKNEWCPFCKNKTELKLFNWLIDLQSYNIKNQVKYDWCINNETNRYLPFDYCIEELHLIIELDGPQHFNDMKCWNSIYENVHERDLYKMEQANKNGYSIIRIFQPDVYYDNNDWEQKLMDCIKQYENPTNIFISSGDHYVDFFKK